MSAKLLCKSEIRFTMQFYKEMEWAVDEANNSFKRENKKTKSIDKIWRKSIMCVIRAKEV